MSFGLNQINVYLRRGFHLERFDPSQRLIEPRIWIYAGLTRHMQPLEYLLYVSTIEYLKKFLSWNPYALNLQQVS